MSAGGDTRPLIVKRKKIVGGGVNHGGAWKVAYADFVTAMMAFFLLMWLLNATSEDQRKGLADYFNPTLPISRTSAGGAGMLAGETMFSKQAYAGAATEGVPPKPTHQDDGPPLGRNSSAPDAPVSKPAVHRAVDDADASTESVGQTPNHDAAASAVERAEQRRLEALARQVATAMREAEDGSLDRHFLLRITPEGLVIEIIDADDQPLFASASAKPAPILPKLIDVLVPVLGETLNDIAVIGHTDAVPFGGAEYSNWELSADRANAARRLMTGRGLPESRIARVTGKAAVNPLADDPKAPQNRRISITLLRGSPR